MANLELDKIMVASYFKKYRPFLLFLGKFLATYLIFIFLYQTYLNQFDASRFESDGISKMVANQTKAVLIFLNYDSTLQPHPSEPSIRVLINQKAIVRIVEGCNAVSVMILFASFIVAFSGKFWKTILFILSGILLIHILNILRIAFLTIGLLHYKEYEVLMHDIIFPLFIYGLVFALWVIWVNKFSNHAKKTAKS